MKIRLNYVVPATVAIVFIVTPANAKNVPQNPVSNRQSSPANPSTRLSSNKINFPVSHIEAPEKSTTVTKAKHILVTSTVSTSTVASTSVNAIATTTTKVPVNNTMATSPVKKTANNATATTSIEGKAAARAVIISNVQKVTENQTNENRIFIKRYTNTNQQMSIIKPGSRKCREGFIKTSSGYCKPIFRDQ